MARAAAAMHRLRDWCRLFVQTWGEVIEENKTVIWLIGTASSALAGWAVYSARRMHYARIEDDMHAITDKINRLKEQMETAPAEEHEHDKETEFPWWRASLVIAPAVASAFLFGYIAGRTTVSYKFAKRMRVEEGLRQRKVYVAVIPEHMFEAKTLAGELEKAVVQEAQNRRASSSWRSWLPISVGNGSSQAPAESDRTTTSSQSLKADISSASSSDPPTLQRLCTSTSSAPQRSAAAQKIE
jgi:hypothetical protein